MSRNGRRIFAPNRRNGRPSTRTRVCHLPSDITRQLSPKILGWRRRVLKLLSKAAYSQQGANVMTDPRNTAAVDGLITENIRLTTELEQAYAQIGDLELKNEFLRRAATGEQGAA